MVVVWEAVAAIVMVWRPLLVAAVVWEAVAAERHRSGDLEVMAVVAVSEIIQQAQAVHQ